MVYPKDNWLQRDEGSGSFREVLAIRCPNEKCRCPNCECGASCSCNVSPEFVCDPCIDFKNEMLKKQEQEHKNNTDYYL